eukprot:scaffold22146_cov21-Tisochrysis_lutea.AAC.2
MKHLLCDAGLEAFMHSVESVHLHTLMNSADALNVKWDYPLYHVAAHLRTRNRSRYFGIYKQRHPNFLPAKASAHKQ